MQEWVELAAQVLLRLTETLVVLYQEEAESFAFFFATSLSVWRAEPSSTAKSIP